MRAVESEESPVDLLTLDVRQTFRDHIFGCFIVDNHGVRSIDATITRARAKVYPGPG